MKNKLVSAFFLIFFISVFFAACKKSGNEAIVFDNTHPLALAPDVEWAVVTEPYAVFKENDEWGLLLPVTAARGKSFR